jgi:hypothetical protein
MALKLKQSTEDGITQTHLDYDYECVYMIADHYDNPSEQVKIFGTDDINYIEVNKNDLNEFVTMIATHAGLEKIVDKNQLLLDVYNNREIQSNFQVKIKNDVIRSGKLLDTWIELWNDNSISAHIRVNESVKGLYFVTNHKDKCSDGLSRQQDCNTVPEIIEFLSKPKYVRQYTFKKDFGVYNITGDLITRSYPSRMSIQEIVEQRLNKEYITHYRISENEFTVIAK